MARALASVVANVRVHVKTGDGQSVQQALLEAFGWFLGVDGSSGWTPQPPTADGLRRAVQGWVGKVAQARGVWPSQRAAISALVLHGASPAEARSAARAAFRA